MHYLPNFKQLWLSALLKDTSVTTGIWTHTLMTLQQTEHESDALDRSATTPHKQHDFNNIRSIFENM